jgi:hypothetical protein
MSPTYSLKLDAGRIEVNGQSLELLVVKNPSQLPAALAQ